MVVAMGETKGGIQEPIAEPGVPLEVLNFQAAAYSAMVAVKAAVGQFGPISVEGILDKDPEVERRDHMEPLLVAIAATLVADEESGIKRNEAGLLFRAPDNPEAPILF
jgi:hypothetical protein